MINQKVIDGLVWLYSIFDIKLLTVIATGFTIYFGYQKVTKRICVSYSISTSTLYDSHVANLVVSNKRDNSIAISSIILGIGMKGTVELVKFEEPLVLKGYDTKLIDVPKYSSIYDKNGPVRIDIFESLFLSIVTISGEVIECEVESPVTSKMLEGRLSKRTVNFNGIVLTNRMGFIFSYYVGGKSEDVIIDKYGFIPERTPFNSNMLQSVSKEFFENFLISEGYHDYYDNYALYKVKDNLETELILSKASLNVKKAKEGNV
ncbi:hypothetical protein [Klebsiella aerogenes]|uniref:hypothetical protein n=1 Tax=Klebsiella aerogenes TaxID=548 RepID=UPI000B4183F4|nr:hypothetical protein [Klebsiella aerogenes]EKU0355679.1 hypothetical protein [Klebsiella aerogenes]RNT10433.1 hypothetical protein B9Z99_022120 [Klebsiella aerogenes]HBT3172808.1 hypothetical protein [Klebsiella aerogenes]HDS4884006.1 hypothetical protein [Klebsiella aerogenes]HEO9207179.1 hypothetical protein [Klebsiella aerogenes]